MGPTPRGAAPECLGEERRPTIPQGGTAPGRGTSPVESAALPCAQGASAAVGSAVGAVLRPPSPFSSSSSLSLSLSLCILKMYFTEARSAPSLATRGGCRGGPSGREAAASASARRRRRCDFFSGAGGRASGRAAISPAKRPAFAVHGDSPPPPAAPPLSRSGHGQAAGHPAPALRLHLPLRVTARPGPAPSDSEVWVSRCGRPGLLSAAG